MKHPWIGELAALLYPDEVFICSNCRHLHPHCTCQEPALEPLSAQQARVNKLEREITQLRQERATTPTTTEGA